MHGEARHLAAHARLARDCQVPQQILGENGTLIRLAPGPARIAVRRAFRKMLDKKPVTEVHLVRLG